ncbi:MAG: type IV secretory system conjugative DNA transfer family protein [Armatimonadota bacterium]
MTERSLNEESVTPFAITDFRDRRDVFGIKRKDRRNHMYVIGQTGTGKSTLLSNMVISDIRRGEGVALIDPHGDLAENILHFVPDSRVEDIIVFNPGDLQYPIAFNPLEKVSTDKHFLITSGLISVFKKIWSNAWGPRLEHILRNTLLALLTHDGSTLLDIPRLLTDKDFRKEVLKSVRDQHLLDFWYLEFEKTPPQYRMTAIAPILNKTSQFLASLPLRHVVGQRESAFDLRQVMDEGKVLIVNLSKGKIGEDNCSLLGALLVNKIMLAAMSRSDIPEDKRRPFYLYVDEVHNFLTLAFADILSESRKYGLNLILAHQYIDQLEPEIQSAIFGNVGTTVSFRVGVDDAAVMAKEFYPVFEKGDLIGLPNHHIYLKILIDGMTCRPFSAITLPPPEMGKTYKGEIIEYSRGKYGLPRHEVERDIRSSY